MVKMCGTIYAAAPELLLGSGYNQQTDIWSIGCVAFILLSGQYPFLSDVKDMNNEKKLTKFNNANLKFSSAWKKRKISKAAKKFCVSCLQRDPQKRWPVIEG